MFYCTYCEQENMLQIKDFNLLVLVEFLEPNNVC